MTRLCLDYEYSIGSEPMEQRFKVNFKSVTRPLMSWKDEVLATAQQIYQESSKPLMLCYSGGIDSEVVARAFMELKIPFTVLTVRHTTNTNMYDIHYAIDFCRKYGIEQKMVDVEPNWLFGEKLNLYADQGYRGTTLFRYLQLFLLDQCKERGYTPILCGGEQYYYTIDGRVSLTFMPSMIPAVDWCTQNDTEAVPYFYMHNSEIYGAYMKEKLISFMLKDPAYFMCPEHMGPEKIIVYHANWENMPRRSKLTGFEGIARLKRSVEIMLSQKFTDLCGRIAIPVTEVQKQLGIFEGDVNDATNV